jgi:hypothetical protein
VASNYPPGVTGFETQIAGVDSELTVDHREASCQNDECAEFDKTEERQVDLETYYDRHSVYETWSWSCPVCNSRATFDREYDQD